MHHSWRVIQLYGKKNLQNYLKNNGFAEVDIKERTSLNEGVQYSNISDSSNDSIPQTTKNTSANIQNVVNETPLEERLSGDALLDVQDLIAEIENVAEISPNGYVTLYHRTTPENAKKIIESGKMSG